MRCSLSCEAGLHIAFVTVWMPNPFPAGTLVKSEALSLSIEVKQWTRVLSVAGDPLNSFTEF